MNKYEALKNFFGYDSFRQGQESLVDSILSGRDTVGVMPTGAGKSLCYQVPALMMEGFSIVISPLISLMQDQVRALTDLGINAAYINSSLTQAQLYDVITGCSNGAYKLLYVAPERLDSEVFLDMAVHSPISMVCVDEAHCISQWGQDFRPSYLGIPDFIDRLPRRPVVSAFTATATERVRNDIKGLLRLVSPFEAVTGFDRKNLYFEVRTPADKDHDLISLVKQYHEDGRSGIVYCSTRKNVESTCDILNRNGIPCTRYHAGLSDEERRANQEAFIYDRVRVITATNAFGMGIDKSNVSFVIHYNMPKDMESYYQEAGRAGRDGSPSDCILMYSGKDAAIARYLIDKSFEESPLEREEALRIKNNDLRRLNVMVSYCSHAECLRRFILRYFGESGDVVCSNCSCCCGDAPLTDVTVDCQKVLSCIFRSGQCYGKKMISDILRGAATEKIREKGFESLSVYGIMKDEKDKYIYELCDVLTAQGITAVSEEYPVYSLMPAASAVLKGSRHIKARISAAGRSRRRTASADPELRKKLIELRDSVARRLDVAPYIVFSDALIEEMSVKKPVNRKQFLEVQGITPAKADRYGDEFTDLIAGYCTEKGIKKVPVREREESVKSAEVIGELLSDTKDSIYTEKPVQITEFCRRVSAEIKDRTGTLISVNSLRTLALDAFTSEGCIQTEIDTEGHIKRTISPRSANLDIIGEEVTKDSGEKFINILYGKKAQKMVIDLLKNKQKR